MTRSSTPFASRHGVGCAVAAAISCAFMVLVLPVTAHAAGPRFGSPALASLPRPLAPNVGVMTTARSIRNGHRATDVVVGSRNGVLVFGNDGTGKLAAPQAYDIGKPVSQLAAGTSEDDQQAEIAIADLQRGTELKAVPPSGEPGGRATGFRQHELIDGPLSFPVRPLSSHVAMSDLDGDGVPEVVLAGAQRNGGGSFVLVERRGKVLDTYELGSRIPRAMAIGDVNGDGNPDLVIGDAINSTLTVLPGTGNGRFGAPIDTKVAATPNEIAVADFDGDGKDEVATGTILARTVSVLDSKADGTFALPSPVALPSGSGAPSTLTAGDLDGDGRDELVVGSSSSRRLSIYARDHGGTFAQIASPPFGRPDAAAAVAVQIADMNGDGKQDLVVVDNGGVISVLLNEGAPVMAPLPSEVQFGAVPSLYTVSRTVAVENTGDYALRITSAQLGRGPFYLAPPLPACARAIAPGATCELTVRFTSVTGASSAVLDLTATDSPEVRHIRLTGQRAPAADFLQEGSGTLDFGSAPVGRVTYKPVVISNPLPVPVTLSKPTVQGPGADDFSYFDDQCSDRPLGPGEACSFKVRFRPLAAGPTRASILLRIPGKASDEFVQLLGAGTGTNAVSPRGIEFGERELGESSAQTLTFNNVTDHPVTIAAHLSGPNAGDFRLEDGDCSGTLLTGQSCRIRVVLDPRTFGQLHASVQLRADGGDLHTSAPVSADVARVAFDSQPAGTRSVERTVTWTNRTDGWVKLAPIAKEGDDADFRLQDKCSGRELGPGHSCTVLVQFTPAKAGTKQASLLFANHRGSAVADRLNLVGRAIDLVAPRSVAFGDLGIGLTAPAATVTFDNATPHAIPLDAPRVQGPGADAFQVLSSSCPTTVPAGGRCAVSIGFNPKTAGDKSATLRFTTAGGAPLGGEVALSGRALLVIDPMPR